MGNNVKKRFTVSLDLETKDIEKQFVGIGKNIKTILADLGSASDKMGYFKDLVGYIGQIDSALVALRAKNKDAFDHMFDGLDANLKKEFEQIFGVAQDQLGVLDQLKDKLAALKSGGTATGADLKPLEQEVKSLYESLGMLDKLDMSGKGKIETRIKKLEAALENFAIVFGDVNAKISQGLNFGPTTGGKGNVIPDVTKDLEEQLKKMKKDVKKAVDDFWKELTKIKGPDADALYDIEDALQQALGFGNKDFYQIGNVFAELEQGTIEAEEAVKKINSIVTEFQKAKQEVNQVVNTGNVTSGGSAQPSLADTINQETNETISAIDYGKQQLVKAWKDYYKAVQEAKDDDIELEMGEKSAKMAKIEESLQDMLDDFGIKAAKPSKWGIEEDLKYLTDCIIDGDVSFDEIEQEVNNLFAQHEISFSASLAEMKSAMGDASENMAVEMHQVEDNTNSVLNSFQELVNYISQSGQKPGTFFDKLESGAQSVDDELKQILQSLNLIDSAGNINFSSINSGFTNKGGFVSDQYTMIARRITGSMGQDYLGKSQKLQSKLASAQAAGAQIGAIFDLIKDEANGLFYEIQNTVAGEAVFSNDYGTFNLEALEATEDQIANLVHTMKVLSDNGLFIDFGGSNILYDKDKGFSIIDLGLHGGNPYTVSNKNTLQENIDRFISECMSFAPNKTKDIQSILADKMYAVAKNIDSYNVKQNSSNQQATQSKGTVAGLNAEEDAHTQNQHAIQAEKEELKELIDLKKKAQSMSWKDFALDSSLTDAKHAEGLYTLGDMEHYWKKANYEKDVDFHQLSQDEIDAILAKRGYHVDAQGNFVNAKGKDAKYGATLDEVIRSSGAYKTAKAWYSTQQDFTAKTKLENQILEDEELRNIAMNKLYELYKHATNDTIDFNEFVNKTIDVYRGDKVQYQEGPAIFDPHEILAFSMQKSTAEGFAGYHDENVVKTSIKPKETIGSLVTPDLYWDEYEVQVPSHQFPEHDLYLNQNYKSFEEYYQQQNEDIQNGINKYLIQTEKNRVADLLGKEVTDIIDNFSPSSSYLQQFKHGVVPDSIINTGGYYDTQLSDIYNQSDEMQKKLIAYYASLKSMSFGYTAKSKSIGATGIIGAIMNDQDGARQHLNDLTGEAQYNIFGQGAQAVNAEAEAHKKNTQAIKEEAQAKQQLNQVSSNANVFDPYELKAQNNDVKSQIVDDATNASAEHFDKLYQLFQHVNNIGKTVEQAPDVIPDNYVMNTKTGELTQVSDILALINELEQQYGDNLDYVKEHLQNVFTNFDFGAKAKDLSDIADPKSVQDQFDAAYDAIDELYMSASYGSQKEVDALALEHQIEAIQHTYNADPLKLLNGEYADFSGSVEDYSDFIAQLDAFEDKYGENLSKVWSYIESVFKHHIDAMNGLVPDLSDIATVESADSNAKPYDKAEITDKYDEAYNQLTDAYLATYEYEKEKAIIAIKDYINQIQKNVDNEYYDVLDNGQYLNDQMESVEYSDLTNAILDYQNQYNENLTEVWDYLHTVFANHINSIENDLVVEIADVDGADSEFDTQSIGQKYGDAIKNLQSLIDTSVNESFIDMLYEIKAHLEWVQFDVDTGQDSIKDGKYLNPSLEELDYAALSDMVTDFEGIYGESLEQVHAYLREVFKKQFDEIDTLLGINTNTAVMPGADVSKETANLNELTAEVNAVEQAVQNKTNAFEQEGIVVGQVVDQEITALTELRVLLDDIQNYLQTIFGSNNYNFGSFDLPQDKMNDGVGVEVFQSIQQTLGQILTVLQGFTGIKSDHENSLTYQEPAANATTSMNDDLSNKLVGDIATETTLSAVKVAIEQLSKSLTAKDDDSDLEQSLGTLVGALSDSVTVLKDAANGIIQHQKAQKSDTSVAMAKIQDPMQNQMMAGVAKDAVKSLGLEAEVESLQALADGVVKIEGAFKNANGIWEGFTVKINEHNQAVDLAVKKHSAFAKMLNSSKEDDENPHVYDKAEVEARAQKHLEEYAAQGKKATVQFKDSGRYTITILEEIDGLTKQIFQTFDENDDKIERTTVTMSNNQKTKLEALQKKLIDNGLSNGLISDQDKAYQDYQDASDELNQMTSLYSQLDNLSDAEIAKWKQQIALVQQLGNQLEGLIKQRKLANDQKVFESDKGKKLSKFDLDHATLQKDIAIPDSFTSRISDARSAIENATDADSLKIAINNWESLQSEIKKAAVEQDLYFKKTKTTSAGVKPSEFAKSLTSQKNAFEKYKNSVINAVGVTDELKDKLNELEAELGSIGDADGLINWQQSFNNLKTEISSAQKIFKNAKQASAADIAGKANAKFKEVGFKDTDNNLTQEQEEIVQKRKELLKQIAEYNIKVNSGQDAEISGIQQTRDELYKLIDAYKQKHNITGKTYGAKQLETFGAKYNSLMTGAADVGLTSENAAVKNLAGAYQQLQAAQAAFNTNDNLQSKEGKQKVAAFLSAKQACNEYARELKKLVDAEKMLAANSVAFDPLEGNFDDTATGRREALLNFMQSTYGASASVKKFEDDCNQLFFTVRNGDGTFTDMTATINMARTAIYATSGATKELSTGLKAFANSVLSKFKSIIPYLTASFGWQEIWQQIRQGVTYVREIDSALTELKKVTNETDATYDRFLKTMSKTAGTVGSTVSELTTMSADWARLGYSIEEAGKLAESTAILLNVSEFQDANAASEALISTMQAFQYTADESQHVVDILNEVGNNYAVSSDGIATALQDSASALMEAGNNLEQSVALVAAANKVVQDPNSVGSALRTISLRLRGTSVKVLEELGEETDGAAESISKMQEKLKALTGVDILTDSGAYKDTYTILKEIAVVWDDMSSMDQAAALELMAGKNRANTLAAILNNIEDLKGAYESALNAEGSAMRENEAYLDSIQGRIDLFNNALQTFWMNLLNTNAVKGVVDAGTSLLKFADTFIGKLTAIAAAFVLVKRVKDGVKLTTMFEKVGDAIKMAYTAMKSMSVATASQTIASKIANKEVARSILVTSGLSTSEGVLTKELIASTAAMLTNEFQLGNLTATEYIATMSTMGLKTAVQALWQVLLKNPFILVAAGAAILGVALDGLTTTVQEAADKAKEAFDEIRGIVDSTQSVVQSLESELSTLNDKIDELSGKELSFADSEELKRLQKQRTELEHSLKIQKQILEAQTNSRNKQAVASMEAYTKAASQGAEETTKTSKAIGTAIGVLGGAIAGAGLLFGAFTGGTSAVAGLGLGAKLMGTAALMGGIGFAGNKAGEFVGSEITKNDGTYDAWYKTYTDALDTARKEEEKALAKYQKDPDNIKKLDAWREAQQKTMDIETEMYDHMSQMQEYYNGLEYGQSEEIDQKLNEWHNFLDKLSIDQGIAGAEDTALDRIFGENASEEIQAIENQITEAVKNGQEFDFEKAVGSSQELKDTLEYIGLDTEDVKNYFTQIGEEAKKTQEATSTLSDLAKALDSIQSKYDTLQGAIDEFNECGAISGETLKSLIDNNLLQYLTFTENGLIADADAMKMLEQAAINEAYAMLNAAMVQDMENYALGKTEQLSTLAQNAIGLVGNAAENAGDQAAQGAQGFLSFANAVAQAGIVDPGNLTAGLQQIYNAYQNIGNAIGHTSAYKTSDANKGKTSSAKEIDWIEHYYTEIENRIDELNARLENKISNVQALDAKNTIIDQIIDLYDQKQQKLENAVATYDARADYLFSTFSSDIQNKINNGSLDISSITDETLASNIDEYYSYIEAASQARVEAEELKQTIADLAKQKFDNISTAYENEIGLVDTYIDALQDQIDATEARGEQVGASYYEEMIDSSEKRKQGLEEERNALQASLDEAVKLGQVEVGSDTWYEMVNAIYEIDSAIVEAETSIEDYQTAINDLHWENFDKLIDKLTNISDELDNIYERLTDNDEAFDENGNWTNQGIAALGMLTQKMEQAQFATQQYADQINELNIDYAAGRYSEEEYNEKLAELTEGQWESIEAYESAKDEIVDLNKARVDAVKDGMQKELDAYKELIDAKKEALAADKEAHDWAKNIAEKEKNISDIQRKLAALASDNSSSANAQKKRLQAELLKAQEELDEAYYEKSIEDQQDALDKEYESYEENQQKEIDSLEEWLDDRETVIQDSFGLVKENAQVIYDELLNLSQEYGVQISDEIMAPWLAGKDAIGEYKDAFLNPELNEATSAFVSQLESVKDEWEEVASAAEDAADRQIAAVKKQQQATIAAYKEMQDSISAITVGGMNNVGNNDGGGAKWSGSGSTGGTSTEEEVKPYSILEIFTNKLGEKYNNFLSSTAEKFGDAMDEAVLNADQHSQDFKLLVPEEYKQFLQLVCDGLGLNIEESVGLANSLSEVFALSELPDEYKGFLASVIEGLALAKEEGLNASGVLSSIFASQQVPDHYKDFLNCIIANLNGSITDGEEIAYSISGDFANGAIPAEYQNYLNNIIQGLQSPVIDGIQDANNTSAEFFGSGLPEIIHGVFSDITTVAAADAEYAKNIMSWTLNDAVNWLANWWNSMIGYFTGGTISVSGGFADGTANANGTAYADGNWGAPKTETSLVGELGPEILVRNGKWTTVGENGAEFTQVKKGDIIFNHKQSEQLLKNGRVTGRGKAYASGTNHLDDLGEELAMCIGPNGSLQFLSKGVADMSTGTIGNLTSLAQFDTTDILNRSRPSTGVSPSVANNTVEIKIDASVGELIHVEHLDGNNLDEIGKFVDKAWEKKMQTLNNSIKKFTR